MSDNIIPIKKPDMICPFSFEGESVRILSRDGEPWFVLADVCKVLDIGNPSQAATRLDEDEKGIITNDTLGGQQRMTIVNESGLYSLTLTSRKPEAKRFKKWVTSEVLPSIRKTGAYSIAPAPSLDLSVADLSAKGRSLVRGLLGQVDSLLNELDRKDVEIEANKERINELEPKATAYESLTAINDTYCFTDVGHMIRNSKTGVSIGRKKLIQWLKDNHWIYKRTSDPKEPWKARQDKETRGLMYMRVHEFQDKDGKNAQALQARITLKGVGYIARDLECIVDARIILVEND